MAASSPALSNNTSDTHTATAANLHRDTPPKTLRGLNKPKCIQCGNVARSRCPYQSCKSCCSKAQNPCHIHVLKANATFPDKAPTSSSPSLEQKSSDVSPAGNSLRVASLRQLSSNFAQFNNVQMPLRSRKPLTRKDASVINEWRFSKLKEYKDRNIEVENEAFDRYMQNISLLEEVFSVKSILEEFNEDESSISNPNSTSVEEDSEMMISGLKLKLKSNPKRSENFRRRIEQIVDQGLEKFQNFELNNDDNDELSDQSELEKSPKKAKFCSIIYMQCLVNLKQKMVVATKEAQELTEKNDFEPRKESDRRSMIRGKLSRSGIGCGLDCRLVICEDQRPAGVVML
ncbi:hypothetical protein Patl1_18318 [Pistacia atlantica]|uniref:Uncharacterized protein n=1 Tax=Pistacia atlantica TaxID=434234 RepID=A0ACC1C1H8_9ROSI|nr:hypothetical protein Patl1_18318 [Pistacia atlantica]